MRITGWQLIHRVTIDHRDRPRMRVQFEYQFLALKQLVPRIETERQITLGPGLSIIIDAVEGAGCSVKRGDLSVELIKPARQPEAPVGYTIKSKWWCKPLDAAKSFRVTAPGHLQLLGLPR